MYNLLGILVLLIWATSAPLLKQIIQNSNNNFIMVVLSYNIIASVISLLISFCKKEYIEFKEIKEKRKLVRTILLNGFYDVFVALAITFSAIVQYAIIANYLWPIILLILISLKTNKSLSKKIIISAIIGFISIIIIIIPTDLSSNGNNIIGILFGLLAAVSWAFYSSSLSINHSKISFFIQGIAQGISGFMVLLIALIFKLWSFSDVSNFSSYFLILIYSTLNMTLAYVLWITVILKHKNIIKFTGMIYLLPIMSLILTSIWFRESFTPKWLISDPLIILEQIKFQSK